MMLGLNRENTWLLLIPIRQKAHFVLLAALFGYCPRSYFKVPSFTKRKGKVSRYVITYLYIRYFSLEKMVRPKKLIILPYFATVIFFLWCTNLYLGVSGI